MTLDARTRRWIAAAGLLLAFALIVPRILNYTPYARLGVTLDRTPQGHMRVSSVVGPPAQGLLHKGDMLLTVNGAPMPSPAMARRTGKGWLPREAFRLGLQRGPERLEVLVPPTRLSVWQRVRYLLFPLAAVIAAPIVAIVLFWRRPDLGTAAVFLWFTAVQATSVVHTIYRFPEETPGSAVRLLMAIMSVLVLWEPAAFLHFATVFPRPRWRPGRRLRNPWLWLVAIGYAVPVAFAIALARNGSVDRDAFRWFESAAMLFGLASLMQRVARPGTEWHPTRGQRALLLVAAALYLAASALDWLLRSDRLMPFFDVPLLQVVITVVSIGTVLSPIVMAYLIARDPVFDPRRLVEKGLPYALLSGVLAAVYLVLVLLGQRLFAAVTGEQEMVFNVVAALCVAFTFAPLRDALQRWLDRLFRRDPMLLRVSLDRAGRELLGALDPAGLRASVEDGLKRGLGRRVPVEWPDTDAPRVADGLEIPEHARAAVENLLAQAGIRLENLELQRQRAADERRAAELREAATRAELRALHAQVQPHFLFNALNALAYLTETDPAAAARFTGRLADMLRYSVEAGSREHALLSDEIGFIEDYLGVARERYDGELSFVFDGPRELLSTVVPPLLLQPLVENSLKHGYLPDHPQLHMRLEGARERGWITLRFRDDGTSVRANGHGPAGRNGRNGTPAPGLGVGLENLEQRIRRFGGEDATVSAALRADGGFEVTMRWRDHGEEA